LSNFFIIIVTYFTKLNYLFFGKTDIQRTTKKTPNLLIINNLFFF